MDERLQNLTRALAGQADANDRSGRWPEAGIDRFRRIGGFGWSVPEAYGGAPLPPVERLEVYEALARGDSVQVMDAGKPIARGAPLEVLGQPGRGRVAALVGVENVFRLKVVSRNARDGTMVCVGGDLRLEVPLEQPASGAEALSAQDDEVTVAIRASDIILAAEEPRGSSARNRLHGVVTSVELRPPGYEVTLDCGGPMQCHITGASLTEMAIQPGLPLWAVFKASSCFLLDEA